MGGGNEEVVEPVGERREVEIGIESGKGTIVEMAALYIIEVEPGNDIIAVEVDNAGGGIGRKDCVAGEGRGLSDFGGGTTSGTYG